MLIVCTVRLHLCKRKFFWLHTIEVIWFFKDLHSSVLLLQQHHSVKKYLLQIPDSKSSHMQPILQPGHFYFRFHAAQIWYQIYWICGKSGNIFYSVNYFFWLNYGASKQLWCIQTSSVTYKYISRKKEIKMVRQTMTEKEGFTNSTFWVCETQ